MEMLQLEDLLEEMEKKPVLCIEGETLHVNM